MPTVDRHGKWILERVEDLTALDPATGKLLFIMDEPTGGTLENAMDTVWAEGKGGRRLYGLDRNKTSRFTCQNGYLVAGALAAQVGGKYRTVGNDDADDLTEYNVPVVEYLKPTDGKIALAYEPVAGSVKYVYEANSDMTQGQAFGPGTAEDGFSIEGKEITLPTKADAEVYIVVYERKTTNAYVVSNDSDIYPGYAKVYITLLLHDVCDINKKIFAKLIKFVQFTQRWSAHREICA